MSKISFKEKYGEMVDNMIEDIRKDSLYFVGPDCLVLLEQLCDRMELKSGMRVLDMGCGAGFTSIILAKEFGVTVYACDLWFEPTQNYKRFVEAGVADLVIPLKTEAHNMPFAEDFFDAAISIDSYHYFGTDDCYLGDHYAKLVKQGGQFGLVNPGLTREFEQGLPEKLKAMWEPNMYAWHSARWWQKHWEKADLVDVTYAEEIPGGKQIWSKTADAELHEADEENYLTLMLMTATKK